MSRPEQERPGLDLPPTRARIAAAVSEEFNFHLDERARELVTNGWAPEAAHAQALREFGDVASAARIVAEHDERAARLSVFRELFFGLGDDLRRAARALLHQRKSVTAVAALTLTLGVAANSLVFGLVDRLLLSAPPHIADADRVAELRFNEATGEGGRITWVRAPYRAFETLRTSPSLYPQVSAYTTLSLRARIAQTDRNARVSAVSSDYFRLLGTAPQVGRFLGSDDYAAGTTAAVISDGLWRAAFGAESSVIGRDFTLAGQTYHVVGVAPSGFSGTTLEPVDLWIPLTSSTPGLPADWSASPLRSVFVVTRLPGRSEAADAIALRAGHVYRASMSALGSADSTAKIIYATLRPGRHAEGQTTPEARVALWLQGVALRGLIIAIANVVNLLLLRGIERQRETAIQLALGVSRIRLGRHALLEATLVAALAALLSLPLVRWIGPLFSALILPAAAPAAGGLSKLLLATGAIAALSALLVAALPAALQREARITELLRGSRTVTGAGSLSSDSLVVIQVMLSVVLLAGAGLFVRSMLRVQAVDLGQQPERVLTARIQMPGAPNSGALSPQWSHVQQRLQSIPGAIVALGLSAPFNPSLNVPIRLPGRTELPGVGPDALGYPTFFAVTPEFFDVMGMRIVRGRNFTAADRQGAQRVMLVDATMARTFWPDADAIGQCVHVGADSLPCATVVGVVNDTKRWINEEKHSLRYYLSLPQVTTSSGTRFAFVRAAGPSASQAAVVRAELSAALPAAAFYDVFPLTQLMEVQTRSWKLGTAAFVSMGLLSAVVAIMGLYAVVSFAVTRRNREIAIRLAVGAQRSTVLSNVIRSALGRALIGIAGGLVLAIALGRKLQDLLFQTSGNDWIVLVATAVLVIAGTTAASALPAWQAARVDPNTALRSD